MGINETIIKYLSTNLPETEKDFSESLRKMLRQEHDSSVSIPNKRELLKSYHKLVRANKVKKSVQLEKMLRRRAVRTLSGVTIITSLVKPYPCPGKCVY